MPHLHIGARNHCERQDTVAVFTKHALKGPPIYRLPTELLGQIFFKYLQDDHTRDGFISHCRQTRNLSSYPGCRATPFILGHVCSYWRNITLSTPILWSSLSVRDPTKRHVPGITLWLERASPCPLSLSFRQSFDADSTRHGVVDEILNIFILHVQRWRNIDFNLPGPRRMPLLNLAAGTVGSLESAVLDLRSWDYPSADKVWRTLHSSPSVRRVEWDACYFRQIPPHVPWAQLTHITIDRQVTTELLVEILRNCQNVVMLDLDRFCGSLLTPYYPCTPLVLPILQILKLVADDDLEPLFDSLTLPALQSLVLSNTSNDAKAPRESASLGNLLVRSSCRLKEFTFCDVDITEDDLLSYLSLPSMATLTELRVVAPITDVVVMSLTRRVVGSDRAEPYLMPHLNAIYLDLCRTSDGVLSDMVASRFSTLNTITLILPRASGLVLRNDLSFMEDARQGGLKVVVFLGGE